MSHLSRPIFFLLVSLALLPQLAHAVVRDVQKIALLGEAAPLTNGDHATFDTFWSRGINNDGEVALIGRLDSSVGNRYGIWVTENGVLKERVRAGQPAPGADPDGTALFTSFSSNSLAFNDHGDIGYLGFTSQPSSSGYWISSATDTVPIAIVGTPVIGHDWSYATANYVPALNNQGQMAFNLSVREDGSTTWHYGIFVNNSSSVDPVILEREPAPGTAGNYSSIIRTNPPVNDVGQTATAVGILDPVSGQHIATAIYAGNSQSLNLLALTGATAPGTSATYNTVVGGASMPLNSAGDTVFTARLQGGDVTSQNEYGLWRSRNGAAELLVRQGDTAIAGVDGLADVTFGVNFGTTRAIIDDSGQVVFSATLVGADITPANQYSLWSARDGELTLLVQAGTVAPGTADVFSSLAVSTFSTNRLGQVAFLGVAGGNSGIWAQDPSGALRLIVRSGDTIEVEPGVSRTITGLEILMPSSGLAPSGGSDGRARFFNDAGQILFGATLDNGQKGLFVSDLAGYYMADFDRDGDVDGDDLADWQSAHGINDSADADGDGDSDGRDFLIWQRQFGSGVGAAEAVVVPEPATAILLASVLLTVCARRSVQSAPSA
jgi:hypothetical protein